MQRDTGLWIAEELALLLLLPASVMTGCLWLVPLFLLVTVIPAIVASIQRSRNSKDP